MQNNKKNTSKLQRTLQMDAQDPQNVATLEVTTVANTTTPLTTPSNKAGANPTDVESASEADVIRKLANEEKMKLTFGDRCRMLFCPIKSFKTVRKDDDTETHITVRPEAFRMLFYLYFIGFIILSMIVGMSMTIDIFLLTLCVVAFIHIL